MNDWEDVPDEDVPVCCPNCFGDTGEDVPLVFASLSAPLRLTLKMVLFGTCLKCGESVACVYQLSDEDDEEDIFPHQTN